MRASGARGGAPGGLLQKATLLLWLVLLSSAGPLCSSFAEGLRRRRPQDAGVFRGRPLQAPMRSGIGAPGEKRPGLRLLAANKSSRSSSVKIRQPAPLREDEAFKAESAKEKHANAVDPANLVTMHGCTCKASWSVGGRSFKSCARAGWNSSMPFCYLEGECAEPQDPRGFNTDPFGLPGKPGEKWDYCAMPEDVSQYYTHAGCHCLPNWEFENSSYHGCASTPSLEPSQSWCYVADTKDSCAGANEPETVTTERRTQRWDHCDMAEKAPAFFTKQGCSCAPTWNAGGKKATSCVMSTEMKPPADLGSSGSGKKAPTAAMLLEEKAATERERSGGAAKALSERTESLLGGGYSGVAGRSKSPRDMLGWCFTFQDERGCPGALIAKGKNKKMKASARPFDTCFLLDEASVAEVHPTVSKCHCMPEWDWNEGTYQGCAQTPGTEKPWCMVLEDERVCTRARSSFTTKGGATRKWDYCDPDWGKAPTIYRPADQRFEAKENNPPEWYRHWYQDFERSQAVEDVEQEE